jgi:hypothetical protein
VVARAQERDFDSHSRKAAGSGGGSGSVDELARLAQIRARGDITDLEYARAKNLVLSGTRYSG